MQFEFCLKQLLILMTVHIYFHKNVVLHKPQSFIYN